MKRTAVAVLVLCLLAGGAAHAVAIQWSGNGHYYEEYLAPPHAPLNWFDARDTALTLPFVNGWQGHLATFTSAEEWAFYTGTVYQGGQTLWLGGFQPAGSVEPAGGWSWVTGEVWDFTAWANGEPEPNNNTVVGNEDALQTYWPGVDLSGPDWWNDRASSIRYGMVVEYEFREENGRWESAPSPELGTWALLACTGLVGLIPAFRRRRRK